jgi:hypothetical protein
MGEIVAKRDTLHQCWARLRLENGDLILISVAQSGVKIIKLKWGGIIPAATLWKSSNLAEVAEKFVDINNPFQRPLDLIICKLIDCRSAAHVVAKLVSSDFG